MINELLKKTFLTLLIIALIALIIVLLSAKFKSFPHESNHGSQWLPGVTTIDCWFDAPGLLKEKQIENKAIECGEYRTDELTGQFILPFVIIKELSQDKKPDPVVYLSGGPGNSTYIDADNIDSWFYWLEDANIKRDLILLDQRGTGLSQPNFRCRAYDENFRQAMGKIVSTEEEYKEAFDTVRGCVDTLSRQGFNPAHYSTRHSARDMNSLLHGLGIEEWNVVGTSYGTRLALDWLRLNQNENSQKAPALEPNIRSVVLDSIYPLDKGLLTEWPESIESSFSYFFDACNDELTCGSDSDEFEQKFRQVLEVLKQKPKELQVPLWHGDPPVNTLVDDNRFISMVISSLYDQTSYNTIIAAVYEIGGADFEDVNFKGVSFEGEPLKILAEGMINSELAPEFNPLTYFAVDCGETSSVTKPAYEAERGKYPSWNGYTEFAWDYDFCLGFPKQNNIEGFREDFVTQVPILLLSGGFDPVTPSSWAEEFSKDKENVTHWHLPDVGHGVAASSLCVHKSLGVFLEKTNQFETPLCVKDDTAL